MKIIYCGGSYRAPTVWQVEQNIQAARQLGAEVARRGAYPVIPHANTAHFDGLQDDEFWLNGTLELLRRCDAVMLVPGWRGSSGTCGEVEEAHRLGLPVFESIGELRCWLERTEAA